MFLCFKSYCEPNTSFSGELSHPVIPFDEIDLTHFEEMNERSAIWESHEPSDFTEEMSLLEEACGFDYEGL